MKRYFIEVAYMGTAFHGSQLQGTTPTVQLYINQALSILLKESVISFGASRTDEGVHALCAYYHFDTEKALHPQFQYKLNAILPETISVVQVYECLGENPINARFDAIARGYRYIIYKKKNPFLQHRALYYPYSINRSILDETAAVLKQFTDFETFSKKNTQTFTFQCTIFDAHWEENTEDETLHFVVKANRFLRGMVRGLVGTQLQIARKNKTVEDFIKIIESKDCNQADFSVAGHGLYLENISYPDGKLLALKLR